MEAHCIFVCQKVCRQDFVTFVNFRVNIDSRGLVQKEESFWKWRGMVKNGQIKKNWSN